ncbi:MAG: hypothetical protein QOH71_2482 [Blastocatellia bacterium]|jgi:hypothetical protein|nr:hypothetical protein [Blastocatellia bacterium]
MKNIDKRTLQIIGRSLRTGFIGLALSLCLCAFAIVAVNADGGSGSSTKIEAEFAGAMLNGLVPKGEAELETFADGNRKFEVTVSNVNLPNGTVLNVLVDGAKVGTLTVGALTGQLELKTKDGQTVPQINTRTRVAVTDQAGNTIVAGSFSNIPPTPTPSPGASPTPSPSPSPGNAGETRIESRLAGAAIGGLTPKGHARFEVRANGRRKLNVEIEKVNLPAGTILNVLVDNFKVGQIVLSSTLENELELDTERGNPVPNITTASTVVITNSQGKTILSGTFNTTATPIPGNDIDDDRFFVEQHYRDFFDREGDDNGLDFWQHQITNCGDDSGCKDRARINTSGAFFLSIEFQDTGFLLYRFNKASFGTMPRRNDFLIEMQAIAQGVVVGQPGWQQKLEDNKRQAAERWTSRQDFRDRFASRSNGQFVDDLFANAGIKPTQLEREDLIRGLDSATETRGSVLRKVSERSDFSRKEQNSAFVLMQYFGYLHRNPDEGADHDLSGFNFWLKKLDDNGGDFRSAEMVKAFLSAGEYRHRFEW